MELKNECYKSMHYGSPKERGEKGAMRLFKEIMAKNLYKLEKIHASPSPSSSTKFM